MLKAKQLKAMLSGGRVRAAAQEGDDVLGALKLLPGRWEANEGTGWNVIALPFKTTPDSQIFYRVLVNQYNEVLEFNTVDKAVPNRGISGQFPTFVQSDQFIAAMDYQQSIDQIAAADFPVSGDAGPQAKPIHFEPGLWLHMANETTDELDLARLSSVPHGDSVLALGRSQEGQPGKPNIPFIQGLPVGVTLPDDEYLAPYLHFQNKPFFGTVPRDTPGFPGFDPTNPTALLDVANADANIVRHTEIVVDTDNGTGGIHNIPFIVKQANATSMKSWFWISELADKNPDGSPVLQLQYAQVVMLDFFPRTDGLPGLIKWPHVSINTLRKVPPASR